ncbi:MAG: TolC family protein [Rikenellaceae bacterium]
MTKIKAWKKLVAISCCALSFQSYAQDKQNLVMNLQECLSYAKEHSITLQKAKYNISDSEIEESTAKGAFLPKVSASVGQNFGNTPFTEVGDKNVYTGSYGADLSLDLYKGGSNSLTLKQSKVETLISKEALKELENSLEVSVTQVYIEILYSIDQIKVVENSLELSLKNVERGKKQLELGSINESDYAQLETAVSTEQYNLVVAKNALSSKYLTLKQLLEISDQATLSIPSDELASEAIISKIPSLEQVYAAALESRAEIKASKLSIESAEYDQKLAKSDYLPTISLSAGIGLSHNTSSDYTFSNQLKNNYNHSVGVNVSVPIFNRNATKNAVKKSQNAVSYAKLELKEETKNLYQTIESLYNNAVNAKSLYEVSEVKLKALDKSLELVTKQFELGSKDIIDLLTEQDSYRTASGEYLENKYTFILNKAILNFYQNGIIKL